MIATQVVEPLVTNNSPFHNYPHPDLHTGRASQESTALEHFIDLDCLAKRPQKRKGKHGYTLMTFTMGCQLISYCTRYNFDFLFQTQPPISVAQMTSSSKK